MGEGKKNSRQELWNTCGFLETSFVKKKEHDRLSLAYQERKSLEEMRKKSWFVE